MSDDDYDMGLVRHEAPERIWLVKPKSDARFHYVCESEGDAREYVEQRPVAEMAGPYVLASDAETRLKEAAALLEELEWSANIGQNGYGCGICQADAYHRRGGDHHPECRLAAFLKAKQP